MCLTSWCHIQQIFESGTASAFSAFYPSRSYPAWALFANSTQACAKASPNNTLACLRSVSEPDLLAAINASLVVYQAPFLPSIDGPGGILSDHPEKRLLRGAGGRVPLMLGTVKDEGQSPSTLTGNMDDRMQRQEPSSFRQTSLMKTFLYG